MWVVVERDHRDRLTAGTIELLRGGCGAGGAAGGTALAVLIGGPGRQEAVASRAAQRNAVHRRGVRRCRADAVLSIEHPALGDYSSEGHAAALQRAIVDRRPEIVLLPSTERGRDLAPRLAARLRLGLTGDAVGLSLDDSGRLVALKPAFAGEVVAPILSRTTPQMATVRPGIGCSGPQRATGPRARCCCWTRRRSSARAFCAARSRSTEGGAHLGRGGGGGGGRHGDRRILGRLPLLRGLADLLGGALCATGGWRTRAGCRGRCRSG